MITAHLIESGQNSGLFGDDPTDAARWLSRLRQPTDAPARVLLFESAERPAPPPSRKPSPATVKHWLKRLRTHV